MTGLTRKIRRFWTLPLPDKRLFVRAVFALLRARMVFARLTIGAIERRLNAPPSAGPGHSPVHADALAADISRAVNAAASAVPWRSDCLVQAIAASAMLRRRGVNSALYIGTRKDGAETLAAHAWLMHGERVITGASDARFDPIITPPAAEQHAA